MSEFSENPLDLTEFGYSSRAASTINRLGMVATQPPDMFVNGRYSPKLAFEFVPDTPMGRANRVANHDLLLGWFEGVTYDAQTLGYLKFAKKYPELAPYETPLKSKVALGALSFVVASTAIVLLQNTHEIFHEAFTSLVSQIYF